jgi:hypothetical protein
MLDSVANFINLTLSTGYGSSDTSIVVSSGGSSLPSPNFNMVWWNSTDYPDPSKDPNVEIVRVTGVSGNTLTVTRGQEGIVATTKNTAGKTYSLILGITAKMITDIQAAFNALPAAPTVTYLVASSTAPAATIALANYVCDGVADDVQIQAAISAVQTAGGGIVELTEGTFNTTATLEVTASNVVIRGRGQGVTTILAGTGMTGNTPVIEYHNTTVGTDRGLTVNTVVGGTTVTMATTDSASFSVGQWVLLKSNKQVDSEITTKYAGELHQILAIDNSTGIITLDDVIYDTYNTSDSAALTMITMLSGCALREMTVTTQAASSSLTIGFIHFQFCNNLTVKDVEMGPGFFGMQLHSCIDSEVSDCYFHDIIDSVPGANTRYGIWIASASENVNVSNCRISKTRHAVTFGGSSGTNYNGIQRNCVISNCVSRRADTAGFDTHEPCQNISFIGCSAIGGQPVTAGQAYGFQSRGQGVSFIGCMALDNVGRGFMIFDPFSNDTLISGCYINGTQAYSGANGMGIYIDSGNASRHVITGNIFRNCGGSAISNGGNASNVTVTGNVIDGCGSQITAVGIYSAGTSTGWIITGNQILNQVSGRPIQMSGSADNFLIANNIFSGNSNNAPAIVGTNSIVKGNIGTFDVTGTNVVYDAITTTTTLDQTFEFVDCTSGTFTVTLPSTSGIAGRQYTIKNSGTGVITIGTTSSQTIDGSTTQTLSTRYSAYTIVSDGSNWKIKS